MVRMRTITEAIDQAENLGREHGEGAAEWWLQDTVGGRAASRDINAAAARVLSGIADGDPEVLDSLPCPDLSGEWADGYSAVDLIAEMDPDGELGDLFTELADAYERAYQESAQDAIYRACEELVSGDEETTVH